MPEDRANAAPTSEFPFRQVHLDFHTSEAIEGVGADFDPGRFAETLARARVNSVTCFARGHHGYMYYGTRRFPERRHPHLACDLLEAQIEACHGRGIRVPIYVTVGWDHYTANRHPEWLCRNPDGSIQGTPPGEPGFYRNLCVNSPYRDFLEAHVEELFQLVPVDGLFLDIVEARDCACSFCRAGMEAKGWDPRREGDRRRYGLEVWAEFQRHMTGFIRGIDPECSIFYNGGHVGPAVRPVIGNYTHLELESLPSGGWGYLHFPLTVRYARKLTDRTLGMTGRFHTSWGDFHAFKNRAALAFECATMLAHGARCSIGDQLHPRGALEEAAYERIGSVYREVERKEPWCEGARPLAEIALYTPEEFVGGRRPPAAMGAVRMLQEGGHQFDVVDSSMGIAGYRVAILPDVIPVSREFADRLEGFLAGGGAVIASHRAGLDEAGGAFGLGALGLVYEGEAPYSPDFIVPRGPIGRDLPPTEHVMYLRASKVRPVEGAEVLCDVVLPYFERTAEHFCSHRHAPSSGRVGYPGIVRRGRAIYFAHPIFAQYHASAPLWVKRLFLNALDLLLPDPLLRHDGPSSIVATVTEQPARDRRVVHLLGSIPERRGEAFDTIEDVIPIHDVGVSVRVPRHVRGVALVPEGEEIPFEEGEGHVAFTVPVLEGHRMVEIRLGRVRPFRILEGEPERARAPGPIRASRAPGAAWPGASPPPRRR